MQWELAWKEQNGGEELDYASDGDADEEDGSDEEEEKPKKKAKVVSEGPIAVALPTVPAIGGVDGQPDLKRKRGRPRKNPLPMPVVVPAPPPMHLPHNPYAQHQQQSQQGGGKYLLGIFLLFTFLNPSSSPSTSSHAHTHAGSVLSPHKHVGTVLNALNSHPASQYVASYVPSNGIFNVSWSTVVQYSHAIISLLVFFSVVHSLLPSRLTRKKEEKDGNGPQVETSTLKNALEKDDRKIFGEVLGCRNIGVFCATWQVGGALMKRVFGVGKKECDSTKRAAIVRLAELDLMQRELFLP